HVADPFHVGDVGDEGLVHWRLGPGRRLEREDHVVDRDRLAVVPLHAGPEFDFNRLVVDPVDLLGRPRPRHTVGTDAQYAVPDQVGDAAVLGTADVERVGRVDHLSAVDDQVLLRAQRLDVHEGPDVADADASLVDDGVLLEHRLVEGGDVFG